MAEIKCAKCGNVFQSQQELMAHAQKEHAKK
ncbi:MAG: C2H2-type zinc finger protein [Chloroflexi bacterium]|nr:C2H2-type zinc finger protein [Chloroflexota bacterium]